MKAARPTRHKSDSHVQRGVEAVLVRLLAKQERVSLEPHKVGLRNGAAVNVDGFNERKRVLCEVYAHVGKTRGSQPGKIAKDILKLVAAEKRLGGRWRKIICFANKDAAACVENRSWLSVVAEDLRIQVIVVKATARTIASVWAAQELQRMVNR